eukprot:g13009.t1
MSSMLSTSSKKQNSTRNRTGTLRKPALLYAVFITTFPGGSLLYSKIYKGFKEKGGDSGIQMQQPHPMTFAALFYAIQTYANELCTENVMRLQHFCHDGKMVCFKIVESILVITVTSSNLNGSNAAKHCELVANKFLAKLKEQPETLTSGQKIKGFSRELKKCNIVLMKSLIRQSALVLKFENVNNIQELQKNDPVHSKNMIDFLVATLHLPDLPKPRSTGSQASNILDKEDTSLQPSFVKKKVSKSSVFGGFKFFSRGVESRAKSSNSKKGNAMKTYKKNIQKEIKSISSDDKQMISTLYKFKVDATAGTDAAEAIGDAKLSIETSLPGEKKSLLNYLESFYSDILDGSSTWYSVKAGSFVGCACGDLLLATRDPSRESSIKDPVFAPPFPLDLVLEDIDLMTLHSLASGLHQQLL